MNQVKADLLGFRQIPDMTGAGSKWYKNEVTRMVVGVGLEEGRWHLSASFYNRTPDWNEMKRVRDIFLPEDRFFMFPMPPEKYYINKHPHCLHLWEIIDDQTKDFLKAEGS